jgi:AraC-like DNA-binding protein
MWFAIGMALFQWCVVLTAIMVEGGVGHKIGLFLFIIEPTIVTALILRQKDLYKTPAGVKTVANKPDGEIEELTSEKRNLLKNELLLLIEKNEIYKDPELNRDKVCSLLNTNRTYLYQVINVDLKKNFYELINDTRLNKSIEVMKNPQSRNMSLTMIAEQCGFKSLRAFGAYFKQVYGKTPTEWRKEALSDGND